MGIFQVTIFWVGIFRVGILQGGVSWVGIFRVVIFWVGVFLIRHCKYKVRKAARSIYFIIVKFKPIWVFDNDNDLCYLSYWKRLLLSYWEAFISCLIFQNYTFQVQLIVCCSHMKRFLKNLSKMIIFFGCSLSMSGNKYIGSWKNYVIMSYIWNAKPAPLNVCINFRFYFWPIVLVFSSNLCHTWHLLHLGKIQATKDKVIAKL